MSITELYQRIMQRHCQIVDLQAELHELHAQQGRDINALSTLIEAPSDSDGIAPRGQWPEIGRTTALEFIGTDDGLVLRGTVDIECHEKTSEVAEADFLTLHPFAPGVRTKFAEWPSGGSPAELATHAPSTVPPFDHVSDTVPCAADFAPDADPGVVLGIVEPPASEVRPVQLHPSEGPAIESGPAPKSGVRAKEVPRTCIQWASDDVAWKNYVRSIQAHADDSHPAKKYTPAQLEDLRVQFLADPAIVADGTPYARPGAKFTRWLEGLPQ